MGRHILAFRGVRDKTAENFQKGHLYRDKTHTQY